MAATILYISKKPKEFQEKLVSNLSKSGNWLSRGHKHLDRTRKNTVSQPNCVLLKTASFRVSHRVHDMEEKSINHTFLWKTPCTMNSHSWNTQAKLTEQHQEKPHQYMNLFQKHQCFLQCRRRCLTCSTSMEQIGQMASLVSIIPFLAKDPLVLFFKQSQPAKNNHLWRNKALPYVMKRKGCWSVDTLMLESLTDIWQWMPYLR